MEKSKLCQAIERKVKEMSGTYYKYIVESHIDTIVMTQFNGYVTFKMSKEYEYTNELLCNFAKLLHSELYMICVIRGTLRLRYVINEKGAREIEKEDNQIKD